MENKSVVITLVLVFIAGLLLGNVLIGGFTGQVTRTVATQVYISPTELLTDEYLRVTVIPGSKGADSEIFPYKENEYGQVSRVGDGHEYCRFGKETRGSGGSCLEPVTFDYKSSLHWQPGTYFLQVYDRATKSNVKAYFTITGSQPPRGV